MIDVETFKSTIIAWVGQTLGSDFEVFWKNQGQPEPPKYVSVWPLTLHPLSARDTQTETYDVDADRIRLTNVGPRKLMLQIDVYTDERLAPNDALSLGSRLYDSLRADKAKELFTDADISILPMDRNVHNLAILASDEWVGRHSFEVAFQIESTHVELVDYFTHATVTSGNEEIDPPIVQELTFST